MPVFVAPRTETFRKERFHGRDIDFSPLPVPAFGMGGHRQTLKKRALCVDRRYRVVPPPLLVVHIAIRHHGGARRRGLGRRRPHPCCRKTDAVRNVDTCPEAGDHFLAVQRDDLGAAVRKIIGQEAWGRGVGAGAKVRCRPQGTSIQSSENLNLEHSPVRVPSAIHRPRGDLAAGSLFLYHPTRDQCRRLRRMSERRPLPSFNQRSLGRRSRWVWMRTVYP